MNGPIDTYIYIYKAAYLNNCRKRERERKITAPLLFAKVYTLYLNRLELSAANLNGQRAAKERIKERKREREIKFKKLVNEPSE